MPGINCGQLPQHDLSNQTPIAHLKVYDIVKAGDFPITLTTIANDGAGRYSGAGWVRVPWMGNTKIKVTFRGIKVNTDYKLIDGFFETTYNADENLISNVEEEVAKIEETVNDVVEIFEEIKKLIKEYKGTEKDKQDITEAKAIVDDQYSGMISSPYLTPAQKAALAKSYEENKGGYDALSKGDECDSTASNASAGGPAYAEWFVPVSGYDCHKAKATTLADALITAAKQEQEAMSKDLVYTAKKESNELAADNLKPAIGLSPNGKIIAGIQSNKGLVPLISKEHLYFIIGFSIYENNKEVDKYIWKQNDRKDWGYYDSKMKKLEISDETSNRKVYVYRDIGNNCTYERQLIDWDNTATTATAKAVVESKIIEKNWIKERLFNADGSCAVAFIKEIITREDSEACKDAAFIEAGYDKLMAYVNRATFKDDDVVAAINSVCLSSIRKLKYAEIIRLFKPLAASSEIDEAKEVALLRLMNALNTTDYEKFFGLLEENNNALLINLVKRMHDGIAIYSALRGEKNSYTNFIGALVWMFKEAPESIENRWPENIDDFARVTINLNPIDYTSDTGSPYFQTYTSKHNNGTYKEETGEIVINDVYTTHVFSQGAYGSVKKNEEIATVSPLTPIVIIPDKGKLPLIKTALGENNLSNDAYIVPAIFLKYNSDKIRNDYIEKGIVTTLDVATIALSGGTALAAKVNWVRRAWAMAEVVGAVGNIAVNTQTVDPNSSLGKAINAYNLGMGIIGLKNVAVGGYKFAKSIPDRTKALLQDNKGLRNLLLTKYLDYRISITKLKNSDEWNNLSAEVRQNIVKQEKAFIDITDAKNIPNDNWGVSDNVFINGKTKQDILTIPKGERPLPETYLSANYIQQHLKEFEGGVTKISASPPSGSVGPLSGTFVMPKNRRIY
ncbi:hypothetical protein [Niabella ginsengisoli]|uniref:Uncharacterized protein n=1 Tax=Niabella ginsengisoli TaxID=522298 RepID=A0ABS9SI17_9BACT|nr:hypothetical protein [Niabella ginsengisoli]MCH5597970.1 hypothetical protein [Niabella ginsengisoli]